MNQPEHPVQFQHVGGTAVACKLCGCVVLEDGEWMDIHRESHDKHNMIHNKINDRAGSYTPPPSYR